MVGVQLRQAFRLQSARHSCGALFVAWVRKLCAGGVKGELKSAMRVSLIATVYNEVDSVRPLMESLLNQTRPPDEIVICDGGSQDGTVSALREYGGRLPGLQIIEAPGVNISQGRNRAIAAAAGPIIATTDAGVRLDCEWLNRLVAPLEGGEGGPQAGTDAVAGFFLPDVSGAFQMAMGATVLPRVEEIDPASFLPSSRSMAYLKESWRRVGGYPEWLDYSEDLVFDLRLRAVAANQSRAFVWTPDAFVHFQPRKTLAAFWKQYFRYARGDGKADLWRLRHAIRFATYLLLIPALLGHALWGLEARWLGWAGLIAGGLVNCARPWRRLLVLGKGSPAGELVQAAILVPVIRFVGDAAKICGYPIGVIWRWKNRHRKEIIWRKTGEIENAF